MTEIIKTDGTRQPVQPANGSDFTLKEMQAIVGGYIELVELDGNTTMVVNEEGKLIPLSLNLEASRIFRAHHPASKDFIVGDVLVCITIKSDKIMDKEKAKALSETLARYEELQENGSVNLIEFHTADGQKHGIGNPEASSCCFRWRSSNWNASSGPHSSAIFRKAWRTAASTRRPSNWNTP